MAKKKTVKPDTGPKLSIGSFCKIRRPNLWQGFHCLIEAHRDECHIVRLTRVDGTSFLAPVRSGELETLSTQ